MTTQSSIPNGFSEEHNIKIANMLSLIGKEMAEAFARGEEFILTASTLRGKAGIVCCKVNSPNFSKLVDMQKQQFMALEKRFGSTAEIITNKDKTITIKFDV